MPGGRKGGREALLKSEEEEEGEALRRSCKVCGKKQKDFRRIDRVSN